MNTPVSKKQQRLEREILHEMNSCTHFTGIQNKLCKAGINIRELVGGADFGWAVRIPCLVKDGCEVVCKSRKLPSREQAELIVSESNRQLEATMVAVDAAHAHAKAAGLGQGNGGRGSMPCPRGCGGMLQYSVAGVNGHMHARCDKGCFSWME